MFGLSPRPWLWRSRFFSRRTWFERLETRLQLSTVAPFIQASFDTGADNFIYTDDAFRATANPNYASGAYVATGGFSGGALRVNLGGIDSTSATGISGGWQRSFTLAEATEITLLVRYSLNQTADYDSDERSQFLVSFDGVLRAPAGRDYVIQLTGNGDGGGGETTGWQLFQINLGLQQAGTHQLVIGAHNNKKDGITEATELFIDNVTVASTASVQGPQQAVASLDYAKFKSNIQTLASFGDRTGGTQSNINAFNWVQQQLQSLGYTVVRHNYIFEGESRYSIYATKVGTLYPDRMYIVSAHLDGTGGGGGADDDASGCSLVLELARVLAQPGMQTDTSVRFIFWNNEETGMDGSELYVRDRAAFQGQESSPGSGIYPEPTWLGMIQHDMILYDHGTPPGANQSPNADINIDYRASSTHDTRSAALATILQDTGRAYGIAYPTTIGSNMRLTDSQSFQNHTAAISVRENTREQIENGANPHHHRSTDVYSRYSEADFTFGFNVVKMTTATVAQLAGATFTMPLAADDTASTEQNQSVLINVLANDVVGTGASKSVSPISSPTAEGGTVVRESNQIRYTPPAGFSGSDSFSYELSDGQGGTDSATVTVTVHPPALLSASFDQTSDGFTYVDDTFRATAQPSYASGTRLATGSFSGGGLEVRLGGSNNSTISNMSGGWRRTFTLTAPTEVTATFRYNLIQSAEYESDERSQALFSLNGALRGTLPNDYLAQLVGDGNGGTELSTGWRTFTLNLGTLAAGTHTFVIGGYNSKKTLADEFTRVLFDDFRLSGAAQPAAAPVAADDTASTMQGQPVVIDVLANDAVGAGNVKSVSQLDNPSHGTVTLGADQRITYTPTAGFTGGDSFTYELSDGQGATDQATVNVMVSPPAPPEILRATFDTNSDGFVYVDDTFRATAQPSYASGTRLTTGSFSGGGLEVRLGGSNNSTISNMSGGWRRTFTLTAPTEVTATFRYNLIQSAEYESDERSQALFSVNGALRGTLPNDYLAQVVGNGNGGTEVSTGWRDFQVNLGILSAGTHTLIIGGYNSKKSLADEFTRVLFDDFSLSGAAQPAAAPVAADDTASTVQGQPVVIDVLANDAVGAGNVKSVSHLNNPANGIVTLGADQRITYTPTAEFTGGDSFTYELSDGQGATDLATVNITVSPPAPPEILRATFDTDSSGFAYVDDAFRGTNQPSYASGSRLSTGGFSGGGLEVRLGGTNNNTISNMSGGWRQTFTLAAPTEVIATFKYNLIQSSEYESDERSQVLFSIDGTLRGTSPNDYVAQVVGNGNGGTEVSSGWRTFQVNLGILPAGTHTLIIGGYNNKKTLSDEVTRIVFDDLVLTRPV